MSLFCNMNMFMNNSYSCMNNSFSNFSFFNTPFSMPSFNFGNFWNFNNSWNCSNFGNFNNISIFNNYSMPSFGSYWGGDSFSYSGSTKKVSTSGSSSSGSAGQKVLNKAMSYVGKVNNSEEGNRLFSPKGYKNTTWYKQKGRWGWCCDFATYCASETLGSKYPSSMKTSSPGGLKTAAGKAGCWVNGWSTSAKPGDILLLPGSGDSGLHIAILKEVQGDTLVCVSGNSGGGKVKISNYKKSSVKGFVSLEKLA